jgi:flagellar motility protein MotE (MotC chaperone)
MLFKISIFLFIISTFLNAAIMEEGSLFKEKQELMEIKDELNEFYEAKELDYQRSKAELESIQKEIKIEELSIRTLRDENQKILDEIKRVISTKSMTMYDKMKLGVVVNIFNEMIKNGEINEVFDIMIRLKEKRVIKILKKFDTKTSAILMKKMRIKKEEENKTKETE